MMPFEIKGKLIFYQRKGHMEPVSQRWFRRKVEIGSRWVWVHFRMSETELAIKHPSSPLSQKSRVLILGDH